MRDSQCDQDGLVCLIGWVGWYGFDIVLCRFCVRVTGEGKSRMLLVEVGPCLVMITDRGHG